MKKIFSIRVGIVVLIALSISIVVIGLKSPDAYYTTKPLDSKGTTISVRIPRGWSLRFQAGKQNLPITQVYFDPTEPMPWLPQWIRQALHIEGDKGVLQIIYTPGQPKKVALQGNADARIIPAPGGGSWVAMYSRADREAFKLTYKDVLNNIRVNKK